MPASHTAQELYEDLLCFWNTWATCLALKTVASSSAWEHAHLPKCIDWFLPRDLFLYTRSYAHLTGSISQENPDLHSCELSTLVQPGTLALSALERYCFLLHEFIFSTAIRLNFYHLNALPLKMASSHSPPAALSFNVLYLSPLKHWLDLELFWVFTSLCLFPSPSGRALGDYTQVCSAWAQALRHYLLQHILLTNGEDRIAQFTSLPSSFCSLY